ncbi:MAG TPA: chemotaxis protein CheD, partial [Gemmatimonadales bacterium]|nr:chemotaxis protein CheD [Gemmatimonadales bacterium]
DTPPAGRQAFVHTGEVAVAKDGTLFSTVLGSCVSICLWDPTTGIGGINHYLLPDQVSNGISTPRFGNVAVRTLLAQLAAAGADPSRLQAKIFGGAAVLSPRLPGSDALGARNAELARVLLGLAGIPVVAEDVGGAQGRKLLFRSSDGAAWVRKL